MVLLRPIMVEEKKNKTIGAIMKDHLKPWYYLKHEEKSYKSLRSEENTDGQMWALNSTAYLTHLRVFYVGYCKNP